MGGPKVGVTASKPGRIFAGTRGDGVWLSEDFGRTWTKPCYGKRGPGKVRCVAVHPRNLDTIYAGCEPIDVYVSFDAAKNWQRLDSVRNTPGVAQFGYPLANVEPHVRDIVFDMANPEILYAALQVGFMLKSADCGRRGSYSTEDSMPMFMPSSSIRVTPSEFLSPAAAIPTAPVKLPDDRST